MDTAKQIQKTLREKLQQLSKEQLVDALTSIYSGCCIYSIADAIRSLQYEEQQLKVGLRLIECERMLNEPIKKIAQMKKISRRAWNILGILYFPVYIAFWLLHKVARFILAISYFGMLENRIGKDIIKYMFNRYGKH